MRHYDTLFLSLFSIILFMTISSLTELDHALSENSISAMLVCGPDAFFLEAATQAVKEYFADFSHTTFDTREQSINKVIERLVAPTFFVQKELIILKSCEAIKDSHALIDYLQNPNPNIILLFVSESLAKSSHLYKEVAKSHTVLDFPKIPPWEKHDAVGLYIEEYVTSKDRKIDSRALSMLCRSCNFDFWALRHELDKLLMYLAEDTVIGIDAVQALSTLSEDATLWQLTDALYQQDAKNLLSVLANIQKNQVYPLIVIRHLRNSMSQTYNIASQIALQHPPETIRSQFPKLQGKLFEKAYALARRFGLNKLKKSLQLLDTSEMHLKDTQVDEQTLLQTLSLKLRYALHTP